MAPKSKHEDKTYILVVITVLLDPYGCKMQLNKLINITHTWICLQTGFIDLLYLTSVYCGIAEIE